MSRWMWISVQIQLSKLSCEEWRLNSLYWTEKRTTSEGTTMPPDIASVQMDRLASYKPAVYSDNSSDLWEIHRLLIIFPFRI